MEAAHEWGVPPTVYLGRAYKTRVWLSRDRQLAEAYLLHRAGICSGCGQHIDDTTIRSTGRHKVEERACMACKSMAQHDVFHHERKGRPAWLKLLVRRRKD